MNKTHFRKLNSWYYYTLLYFNIFITHPITTISIFINHKQPTINPYITYTGDNLRAKASVKKASNSIFHANLICKKN